MMGRQPVEETTMSDTITENQGAASTSGRTFTGAKPPLKPRQIWSIRTRLNLSKRVRDAGAVRSRDVPVLVTRFYPGVDVVAAFDFPFVDARRVPECFQLSGDPKCPVTITACVTDENIRHTSPRVSRLAAIHAAMISHCSRVV
jgi:hypothetical protein